MREDSLASQLRAAPDDELRATRRDLQTGIAMMRQGSPMHAPATAYLAAITAGLDRRARYHTPPLPPSRAGAGNPVTA